MTKMDCANMMFNLAVLQHPAEVYDRWPEILFEPLLRYYDGGGWLDLKATTTEEDGEHPTESLEVGFFEGSEAQHLCYVMWLYDMNSPLIKGIPEIEKRRLQAAEFSGLLDFQVHWKLTQDGKNPLIQQMAAAYVRLQNHYKFEAIISLEEFVHNQWDVVRQKIPFNITGEDSDKIIRANEIQSKCAEAAHKNTERLEKLRSEFILEQKELFGEIVVEPENKQKNKLHRLAAEKRDARRKQLDAFNSENQTAAAPLANIVAEDDVQIPTPAVEAVLEQPQQPQVQAVAEPQRRRPQAGPQVPTRQS